MSKKSIFVLSLRDEQWDIINTLLEGAKEKTDALVSAPDVNINMSREQINDLKNYSSDIEEILMDIADQMVGLTEPVGS